jgi:hypothetical protein
MARPKSKPGINETLAATTAKSERSELVLTDFRVSKVISERFLAPETARVGTYSLDSAADQVIFPDIEVKRVGSLTYRLAIVGRTRTKDSEPGSEPAVKSFSISIEAEGIFEVFGKPDLSDEVACAVLLEPVLVLVHGLCVHQARAEADSMGYRTIRPSYQAQNAGKPQLSAL